MSNYFFKKEREALRDEKMWIGSIMCEAMMFVSSNDLMISESAWDQSVSTSPVRGKGKENKAVRVSL